MKKDFIENKAMLGKALRRLELVEMEGKFEVSRQGVLLSAADRPRNDKTFAFNLGILEGIDEYKDLHSLAKLMYCIPFELNMNAPWLQL